jgi:hypothetical protein
MADPVFEAFLGGGGVGDDAGLNAFRETVRSNDYFRQAAAPILTTRLNTSMMDPWTAFGTTAAQAFLGSALNTLGKNREAEQLIKAAEVLPSLQKPDINSILGVQAPEGIDPEAFGALKLNAIRDMFQKKSEVDRYLGIRGMFRDETGKLAMDPGMLDVQRQQSKIELDSELEKVKAVEELKRSFAPKVNGPLDLLPDNLKKEAIDQTATQMENQNVSEFINKQFETAKTIPSGMAAIPATTAANEMTGIAVSLTTALQKALGREMNAKEQERLSAAVPDWNDTKEQIEMKKNRYMDLMESISKATPLGLAAPTEAKAAAQGYTSDQLAAAGYSAAEIAHFRQQGVVK